MAKATPTDVQYQAGEREIKERILKLQELDTDRERVKWTLSWSPTLKQFVQILAGERRLAFSQWVEQLIMESVTEDEWLEAVARFEMLERNTCDPKA